MKQNKKIPQKNEASSQDSNQIEKLQAEIEQLRTLLTKYEAEETEDTAVKRTAAETQVLEDLQTENGQLRTLVTKYEAEENLNSSDGATASTTTDQVTDDLRTEIEQLKALVEKYEAEESSVQDVTTEKSDNSTELGALTAQVEKLTQHNTQLQTQLNTRQQTANQPNINATRVSAQQDSDTSFWQPFSWILPLIAIVIGLYLLLRLIKRIRAKKASKELKIALSSSPDTVKSDTASAFSIDGSMLPTASTVEDAPIEADSVEAGVKIDMAKAYLDLDDSEAAQELLQEAIVEGSIAQRAVAENLLKKL